jgi:hypothetical protein
MGTGAVIRSTHGSCFIDGIGVQCHLVKQPHGAVRRLKVRTQAKSNSVVTQELVEVEGQVLGIMFKVKAGEQTLTTTLELEKMSESNRKRALLHWLVQRVSDRAAIARNTESGKSATPEEKFNAMRELVEFYNTGTEEWAIAGKGPGPSAELTLLVNALCEAYPQKQREDLAKWAKARSAIERTALMEGKMLKPIVEKLRAEASKQVDADALLAGLDVEGTEEEKA